MSTRQHRRAALLIVVVAGTLATVGATTADARPWTALFDWQATPTTGAEHWSVEEQDPSPALPGPWYRAWLGSGAPTTVGRGLGVRPLGGRVYDNGDPTQQTGGPGTILRWIPPGSSTITTAAFSQLRYRNEAEGQYLRVRVATGNPATNQTRDFGPAYGQNDPDTTYTPSAVTLTPTVSGLGIETAMFTVCSPAGGGLYTCPNVPTSTGTFGRVGRIEITLDDPDQPVLQIQPQPAIDGGWVNKRRPQKLTVTASDPSSGIQRIQVQLKLGSSTKTLANRVVTCDPLHRTAGREGLVCPATASLNATDPGRDSSTKDRTYLITATDYAGNQTVQTLVVRRDLQKPTSGKLGGDLARVAGNKASGRTGIVPATVTGADSQSGVARLEILARRQTGGRTYVIGTIDADCTGGCKKRTSLPAAADLSVLPKDGRYRLQVRITDQAGNQKTFNTGTLFLDWKAPSAPKATVKISQRDGTASALVTPGRDPAESSGRGDYYLLYPATTDDHGRAIRSGDHQIRDIVDQLRPLLSGPTRIVRSKTRQFPLPGYQLRNQQEPGYILQTDYVRTSSGERRVRVRVGRAMVRAAAGPSAGKVSCRTTVGARYESVTIDARGTPHTFARARVAVDGYAYCRGNRRYDGLVGTAAQQLSLAAYKPRDLPPNQNVSIVRTLAKPIRFKMNGEKQTSRKLVADCVLGPLRPNGRGGWQTTDVTYRIGIDFKLFPVRQPNGVVVTIGGSGRNAGLITNSRCDAVGMWQIRAYEDLIRFKREHGRTRVPDPAVVLRKRLGDSPTKRGYAAHHIIPVFDLRLESARQAEQLGFACSIGPNSAENGIFVKVNPHRRMHTDRYYRAIVRALSTAMNPRGYCDHRKAVRAIQAEVRRHL